MNVEKSLSSGSCIDYRAPCTRKEGRLCDIFRHLPVWNEFFWQAQLELQELSPGELSLVNTYNKRIGYPGFHMTQQVHEKTATLLCHLLTHHHCIVSVDLTRYILKTNIEVICHALCKSASLRKLKLSLWHFTTNLSLSFTAALSQLNQLQVFDCSDVLFDHTFSEGLSKFLASTRSLTTLYMSKYDIKHKDAALIIQGLKRNETITTLAITGSLITDTPECSVMLSEYLRCNQTLRVLSVYWASSHNKLHPIIGALCHNGTIFELNLISCGLYIEYFKLIAGMLRQNQTLRSFHMIDCTFYEHDSDPHCWKPEFRSESSLISLWLMTLAENKALKELTLDLRWIQPDECGSLFKALASNTSLEKVTIDTFNNMDVVHICQALRDTGVPERFFVGKHHLLEDTAAALPECKELSCICVDYWFPLELEPLHTTLCVLPTCDHVKSLSLKMDAVMFKENAGSLVAKYITNTTALRELRLTIIFETLHGDDHPVCDWYAVDRPERTLLQALSLNKGIRRLSLKGLCITEAEAQMLVDTLQSSRTICHFSFYPKRECLTSVIPLIRKLSGNVSSNYMLLGMRTLWHKQHCGDTFTVADVVRRNNSLVTRAADFVMGTRHRYCGAAAELVQFNPGLVEKVQELASVDETVAASRIESSLKSFTELDDFMCLAGVVKYSVTCPRREDCQKQLVDLNRDCWLYIRQFLKVGDILDPK
ncbi:hypothetical protein HPB52_007808 [Rhipicephalus sanguineus]|uniref:Nlr family card domain protein n=1 Tax=Rhipicephalus sanguineus TaxID=34632 RepID=A0A9D4SQG6_RHISA|nr:hypothetical protein HPB52_007808 [Rhipicephalus sanguineus]